jgi:hypothetical protein
MTIPSSWTYGPAGHYSWTFGANGCYTANWNGVQTVTVTLTASGAFVVSASAPAAGGIGGAQTAAATAVAGAAPATAAADLAALGGAAVAGDLGGTSAAPVVAKIQGTPVSAPPGGTAQFLAGNGTWQQALGWHDVTAYGAAGNGSTDDTTAIQAAITAAGAAGGGVVYLPQGNYKVSSTLTVPGSGTAIIGVPTEQVGTGSMISPSALGFTVFEFTGSWYVLRDFTIKWNTLTGASGGAAGPIGIWLNGADNTQISNVQVIHAYNGILVEAGGCTFTGVTVELAAVADTGRYCYCISGAAGNPNSFGAWNCGATCDTSYTGDGWVQCDGFSSVILYNCYAGSCRYAYWSTQNAGPTTSGGTTPSGAVFSQFTCEFCDCAFQLAYGNNLMITGCQIDSMQAASGGIQIASTWSSSGLVQISGLEYGPSQGGLYIDSAATVIVTNALFLSCTQNPSIEISGPASVIISGLWANPSGGAPAASGTVQLDAGFTGSLNMSDFVLLNNVYGFLVAPGATGTFQLSNGKIGTSSSGALSVGASPAGSSITGVAGVNPVGVVTVAVPLSGAAVAATWYDREFYVTTGAGTTTVAISGGPVITLPASGFATVHLPAGTTLTPAYTNAPAWVVEGA